jgi:hypothetical protein
MRAPSLTSDPVLARAHYAWWFRASKQRELRKVIDRLARKIASPDAERIPTSGHVLTSSELASSLRMMIAR